MEENGEWTYNILSEDECDNTWDENVEKERLGLAVIFR